MSIAVWVVVALVCWCLVGGCLGIVVGNVVRLRDIGERGSVALAETRCADERAPATWSPRDTVGSPERPTTEVLAENLRLSRENDELRRVNEVLRTASS